jgi:LuxR family maltose regulon positive regulatory protein
VDASVRQTEAPERAGVPRIPNATVHRRELLARLHAATDCRLILVAAAAGSGKSSLLSHWVSELEGPVAWLSCTDAHADGTRFWDDLRRAIGDAWAAAGIIGAEIDASHPLDAPSEILERLRQVQARGLIVVDDHHLAGEAPAEMVRFIAGLAAGVRLVLSTRSDPAFSLARMRLHGTLLELRQDDLAFSRSETTDALAALQVPLDDDEIDHLHELTEGWPAGVHLVGISLRDRTEATLDLARVAIEDRHLSDYLLNEVVDRQRDAVQEFLMVSAELGSFDPELCDAVMGRTDSARLLDEVRSANLFVVEEPGSSQVRYHHLFHDFLRLRLAARADGRAREVHRRASDVCAQRGEQAEAIRHLLEAGEIDAALALLADQITSALSLDVDGGATVARRWLATHGEDRLAGDASGFLECTMALHVGGAPEEAELWLRRWREQAPRLDHTNQVLLHGGWCFHHLFSGDPVGALAEAVRAQALIDLEPVEARWSDSLLLLQLQCLLWLGDHDAARRSVDAALERPSIPAPLALVRLPALRAQADLAEGHLRAAETGALRSVRSADDLGLPELHFGRAEPELVLAMLDIEHDRFDSAADRLERVMRIAEQRRPPVEVLAHLALATLAEATGDPLAADQCVERARAAQPRATAAGAARIDEAAARTALRRGHLAAVPALIERLTGDPRVVMEARLALATGDRAQALDLLDRVDVAPTDRRSRIELDLLRAMARPRADRSDALASLSAALELAGPEGFHRTLVVEGPPLWDLLEALPAHGRTAEHVAQVLATARRTVPAVQAVDQGSLIDPLSERELTVLRYLASRLDSTEIAGELYVSVNTVRTHVKAIYRKLAVSSRLDAVARARELGLL